MMILIFITCAVINHLFFTLWSTSVMHFLMIEALFKVNNFQHEFSGPHFRLPRFDSPLTTPSEVKINGRRILPVINYYIKKRFIR